MIDDLLAQMTDEEKCLLVSGSDTWHLPAIERLGIGSLRMTDGPNGARGLDFAGGSRSVCYPVGVALGASFDPELVAELARSLGIETKRKGALVLLGPNVNLQRVPVAGRNFECYSEDPLLSSRLCAAAVEGLQSQGVAACVKHFVCNDQETERMSISAIVTDAALHETYLRPFEAGVEAGTWSIMSAYNGVNNTEACESELLQEVLRDQWGFDGVAISDWHALKATVAPLLAGTDIEMPGPTRHRGGALLAALESGQLSIVQLDVVVLRVLRLLERTGCLDSPDALRDETSEDDPRDRELVRRAAADATVLLTNNGILPLKTGLDRLAVIGPNASPGAIQGGGSAGVYSHEPVSPLEGLSSLATEVRYAQGAHIERYVPLLSAKNCRTHDEKPGITAVALDASGGVVKERVMSELLSVYSAPGVVDEHMDARWTTKYHAEADGLHTLGLVVAGQARLWFDDDLIIDSWDFTEPGTWLLGMASAERRVELDLVNGHEYEIRIEFHRDSKHLGGVRVGIMPAPSTSLIAEAVEAARWAELAVVIVGMSDEWESEGIDRDDLMLPGGQAELISAVVAANENTVVVLNVGAPVETPWLEEVAAAVCVWYPGQEFGNALCDVLDGTRSPGGRLPQTWPLQLSDHPAMEGFPGSNGDVHYVEGSEVGYRCFESAGVAPRLAFGFGLSYAQPEIEDVQWQINDGEVSVSLETRNLNNHEGVEVWQLYLRERHEDGAWSPKELVDFVKLRYSPNESLVGELRAGAKAWRVWRDGWAQRKGEIELVIGRSCGDELASLLLPGVP